MRLLRAGAGVHCPSVVALRGDTSTAVTLGSPMALVCDADACLARWWRRVVRSGRADAVLPGHRRLLAGCTPGRMVSLLGGTREGQAELRRHLEGLLRRVRTSVPGCVVDTAVSALERAGGGGASTGKVGDAAAGLSDDAREEASGLLLAAASVQHRLGDATAAIVGLKVAAALDPSCGVVRTRLHVLAREASILKQQEACRKRLAAGCAPKVTPRSVPRVDASTLSRAAFLREYAVPGRPVILTGLLPRATRTPWTFEYIRERVGHQSATLKRFDPTSVSWARLENCAMPTRLDEFIDAVTSTEHPAAGGSKAARLRKCYLHDWGLPLHAPSLAKELAVPEYFAGNLLTKAPPGSLFRDSWPSLFIGPAGSFSSLHVDGFGSNFWMLLLQGRKRWTFYDRSDLPLLYPTWKWNGSVDPTFLVDPLDPDHDKFPLFRHAKPIVCVLEPGEVLFVPAGSPHVVENLDAPTLAVSGNYVDESNLRLATSELEAMGWLQPRALELLRHLPRPAAASEQSDGAAGAKSSGSDPTPAESGAGAGAGAGASGREASRKKSRLA